MNSLLLINTYVFSQCPQSGLKIQSKDCQEPKALSVSNLACTEMKVKWVGNKGQTYMVNATYSNASNDNVIVAKVSEGKDNYGSCNPGIYNGKCSIFCRKIPEWCDIGFYFVAANTRLLFYSVSLQPAYGQRR